MEAVRGPRFLPSRGPVVRLEAARDDVRAHIEERPPDTAAGAGVFFSQRFQLRITSGVGREDALCGELVEPPHHRRRQEVGLCGRPVGHTRASPCSHSSTARISRSSEATLNTMTR